LPFVFFQRGVYDNLLHAFIKICKEEGPRELYRGLSPSLIGVVPYAAINYFAYDTLRKTYRKLTKQEKIGNLETLLMGSAAGAISSTATFPLEVARKQMQVVSYSHYDIYLSLLEGKGCLWVIWFFG
jgi:solute carrier family 25 phosphate transporter 23/24/25/41